jgi:purine-nucleoside phosphorylase
MKEGGLMSVLKNQIDEALAVIRKQAKMEPQVAIVLGTGLGGLAKEIKVSCTLAYKDIPHMPLSTVETHSGELVFGELGGKQVVAMKGRFHLYEGYTAQQVTFPVRVMRALGAKALLISNACGGMNRHYQPGDLMVIEDHINLQGANPLMGPNDDSLGPRFPDMSRTYDAELMALALEVAAENRFRVHKGVYVAVTGPNLETAAEYRFLGGFADVVGMSTVPEVIVGVHAGMRILGISVVTDECIPDKLKPADVAQIIRIAGQAEPRLTKIMAEVIKRMKV